MRGERRTERPETEITLEEGRDEKRDWRERKKVEKREREREKKRN